MGCHPPLVGKERDVTADVDFRVTLSILRTGALICAGESCTESDVPGKIKTSVVELVGALSCDGRFVAAECESTVGGFVWAEQQPVWCNPCVL